MIPLTNDERALDLFQNEAGLVRELSAFGSQHPKQPVLPQHIVLQTQLEEVLHDILHGFVLLQAAHMVKQHLQA